MPICKFCEKECKNQNSLRNHERLCPKNVNRVYVSYTLGRIPWNKGLTKDSNESLLQASETMKVRKHGGWSKSACSNGGKNGGGYRECAGHSKKFYVNDSYGKQVCLQSSYELECSKLLDQLGVRWSRPKYLKYGNKKYFADFLLDDLDIYLDTKNDYLAIIDKEKIESVMKENDVKIYILTKDMINEQKIGWILANVQGSNP